MSSDGALILVVGPSGAGKDSVLRGARQALAANEYVRFARRCITRAPGDDEDNLPLSLGQFQAVHALGGFLLSWDAHGLSYGLPASTGIDLVRGISVVANVSRGAVDAARTLWPATRVVLVTASAETLRSRLLARGRDADIEGRFARASEYPDLDVDFVVANDGELAEAVEALVRIIERLAAPSARAAPAASA